MEITVLALGLSSLSELIMAFNNQAIAASHSAVNPTLLTAVFEVQQILQSFAQANGFRIDLLAPAFGTALDSERLQALGEQFAQGDFSGVPAIALLPSQDLNGAMGVYVSETNQIYLSESLLLHGTQDQIVTVLLEEIGHGLDTQLNVTDSAGDEGAIFSALVQGQILSEPQLAALQAENDQATLQLDGQQVTVEQATLTVNIDAQNVVDGDTSDIAALLADPGADGLISLREAIRATNNTAGADTITFDQAGTIILDVIEGSTNGDNALEIRGDLTIDGDLDSDGIPDVTLERDSTSPGYRVIWAGNSTDETVVLNGLVITGGLANSSGFFGPGNNGGGIFHIKVDLTVSNSIITGNEAVADGGGLYSFGNVTDGTSANIINSTISNSFAECLCPT